MRKGFWTVFAMLVAVGVQAETSQADKVVVSINDETTTLTVDDLADGESRTFQHGDKSIVVTRDGEQLKVEMTGEDGSTAFATATGSQKKVVVEVDNGGERKIIDKKVVIVDGEGDPGVHKKVVIVNGEGEAAIDKEVVIVGGDGDAGMKHKVFVFKGKDGEAGPEWTEDMQETQGAEVLAMMDGKVLFRCADNGVEIHIPKDLVPSGPIPCPVGGGATTEVKPSGKKTFVYKFKTSEEKDEKSGN